MSKFSDTHTALADAQRVREIRDYEAGRIDRQFAPIRAKAAANAKAISQMSGWMSFA